MANHKEDVLFYTRCNVQGKVCSLKIDEKSPNNIANEYMVKKLGLTVKEHPWLDEGYKLRVRHQVMISIAIGKYEDEILCDVQPMETCHILLGKPWQSKHQAIQDYSGSKNRYSVDYKGARLFLVSMTPQEIQEDQLVLKQTHAEASSTSLTRSSLIESSTITSAAVPARLPDSIFTSSPTSSRPPLNVSAGVATSSPSPALPKFRTRPPPLDQPSSSQAPFFQFVSFQLLDFKMVEEVDFVFGDFAFSKPGNNLLVSKRWYHKEKRKDEVMKPQGEEQLEFDAETETDYLMEYGITVASKEGIIFLHLQDMTHPFNPGIYRDGTDLRTNPFQLGEDDKILESIMTQKLKGLIQAIKNRVHRTKTG